MKRPTVLLLACLFGLTTVAAQPPVPKPAGAPAAGQSGQAKPGQAKPGQAKPATQTIAAAGVPQPPPPPPGYTVGPDDVLIVMFWGNKEMSAEVTVRPDGMISLPLLNDVSASGLTPDQLRDRITAGARQFVVDPNVTIVVKTINSRRVFVTGSVARPGPYPLIGPVTVLQAIALAGGLTEFASEKNISVVRTEGGRTTRFRFNYKDVMNGKNLKQNIELRPGDTVIVP